MFRTSAGASSFVRVYLMLLKVKTASTAWPGLACRLRLASRKGGHTNLMNVAIMHNLVLSAHYRSQDAVASRSTGWAVVFGRDTKYTHQLVELVKRERPKRKKKNQKGRNGRRKSCQKGDTTSWFPERRKRKSPLRELKRCCGDVVS